MPEYYSKGHIHVHNGSTILPKVAEESGGGNEGEGREREKDTHH